jgi:hypothetical protein
MNMLRKGQIIGVEKGDSMKQVTLIAGCLEWLSKLNRKVRFYAPSVPPRFLQHNPFDAHPLMAVRLLWESRLTFTSMGAIPPYMRLVANVSLK